VFTLSLNAQRGDKATKKADQKFETLVQKAKENLSLTDVQQDEFDILVRKHNEKLEAVREDDKLSKKDIKNSTEALRAEFNDQVEAMLDKGQNEQWAKMQQKREKRKDRVKIERKTPEKEADKIEESDDDE
jgi:hypothetical protein